MAKPVRRFLEGQQISRQIADDILLQIRIKPEYEGWCHIVDNAFSVPNGGQFEMQISFAFPSTFPPPLNVIIDKENVKNFAEIK